jgi:hypothetical protein
MGVQVHLITNMRGACLRAEVQFCDGWVSVLVCVPVVAFGCRTTKITACVPEQSLCF